MKKQRNDYMKTVTIKDFSLLKLLQIKINKHYIKNCGSKIGLPCSKCVLNHIFIGEMSCSNILKMADKELRNRIKK